MYYPFAWGSKHGKDLALKSSCVIVPGQRQHRRRCDSSSATHKEEIDVYPNNGTIRSVGSCIFCGRSACSERAASWTKESSCRHAFAALVGRELRKRPRLPRSLFAVHQPLSSTKAHLSRLESRPPFLSFVRLHPCHRSNDKPVELH